jgi:prevent-host-death family protein
MRKELPITEARHALTSLPERLAEDPGAVAITRRGKPVLAVMSWDLYESIT